MVGLLESVAGLWAVAQFWAPPSAAKEGSPWVGPLVPIVRINKMASASFAFHDWPPVTLAKGHLNLKAAVADGAACQNPIDWPPLAVSHRSIHLALGALAKG